MNVLDLLPFLQQNQQPGMSPIEAQFLGIQQSQQPAEPELPGEEGTEIDLFSEIFGDMNSNAFTAEKKHDLNFDFLSGFTNNDLQQPDENVNSILNMFNAQGQNQNFGGF